MKAQITIFIIIGILVVVAFGITLYAGTKMSGRIETKETTQRLEQLGLQPLQDYINTCLDISSKEALKLIGKQGGTIYASQGGLTPDYADTGPYLTLTDQDLGELKTPYLVMPPEGNVETLFYAEPPDYPFPGFPYAGGELLFTGYYGMSKMPPLYKKTPAGENVTNSIQENLEKYIAQKTAECTKWKTFEDKGYTITAGNPAVSLIFAEKQEQFQGEKYITIELNWPIEIATPGGDKTQLKDFAVKENVRLATVYFTAKQIIDADVTDISYKPENRESFTVTTTREGEDSIVVLKDTQSTLDNKPYEFWIARKNRRPALWQIDTTELDKFAFHVKENRGASITISGNKLVITDICVNDPVTIELNASDPDENEIIYDVTPKQIPGENAIGLPFGIRVYAKDNSAHDENWYDYQDIQLQVALCPVE
ncbi:Uncharacterised protein [uncultured archaeon]|nr:Uncharacterised protein [uncultured archaeon]